MKQLRIYLLLFCSLLFSSVNAKMQYFRLDSNLSKQKGIYVLVSKFTIGNIGGPRSIDSSKILVSDSIINISRYVTQGPQPADFTTFYDTIYLNINFVKKLKIDYDVHVWVFGKYKYKYNQDSLYLTSDFLFIQKPKKKTSIKFNIYPNPAQNYLHIILDANEIKGDFYCSIFNSSGTQVLEGEVPISGLLDLRALRNGLYFIRLRNNRQVYSESIKLLISK